jgi:hypothetical protein
MAAAEHILTFLIVYGIIGVVLLWFKSKNIEE